MKAGNSGKQKTIPQAAVTGPVLTRRHGCTLTPGIGSRLCQGLLLAVLITGLSACQGGAVDKAAESTDKNTSAATVSKKSGQAHRKKHTQARDKAKKGVADQKDGQEPDDKELVYNVETAKARTGAAQAVFNSTAVLQADREAEVSPKATGVVEEIRAEAGDRVKKGQVLAVLESDQQRLRLQQARANYEKTRNNWERSKKLLAKGLANAESVSNLKYETRVLKSLLDQAQLDFDNTRIKSPIDGTLVKRFIKAGSLVQNGEKAFKVVDFDSLQAVVNVPEMQLQKIRTGLPARLRIDALDNAEVAAQVLRVSPAVDEKTGTFAVTLAIPSPQVGLRPGLFARVAIVYDQHPDAVLVDKNAFIREDQTTFVWKVDGDGVSKQVIRTGYEMPDSIEVLEGLRPGDEVVTTGKNNLSPDARIHVIDYD